MSDPLHDPPTEVVTFDIDLSQAYEAVEEDGVARTHVPLPREVREALLAGKGIRLTDMSQQSLRRSALARIKPSESPMVRLIEGQYTADPSVVCKHCDNPRPVDSYCKCEWGQAQSELAGLRWRLGSISSDLGAICRLLGIDPPATTSGSDVSQALAEIIPAVATLKHQMGKGRKDLTERQAKAMDEVLAELRERWGMQLAFHEVALTFEDETRPGRGHDLRWTAYDDDTIAQGTMDVYGHGSYGVGDVEWEHTGGDECECRYCEGERAADDPCTVTTTRRFTWAGQVHEKTLTCERANLHSLAHRARTGNPLDENEEYLWYTERRQA